MRLSARISSRPAASLTARMIASGATRTARRAARRASPARPRPAARRAPPGVRRRPGRPAAEDQRMADGSYLWLPAGRDLPKLRARPASVRVTGPSARPQRPSRSASPMLRTASGPSMRPKSPVGGPAVAPGRLPSGPGPDARDRGCPARRAAPRYRPEPDRMSTATSFRPGRASATRGQRPGHIGADRTRQVRSRTARQ